MKQLTWLRIVHSAVQCVCLALHTPTGACHKRWSIANEVMLRVIYLRQIDPPAQSIVEQVIDQLYQWINRDQSTNQSFQQGLHFLIVINTNGFNSTRQYGYKQVKEFLWCVQCHRHYLAGRSLVRWLAFSVSSLWTHRLQWQFTIITDIMWTSSHLWELCTVRPFMLNNDHATPRHDLNYDSYIWLVLCE